MSRRNANFEDPIGLVLRMLKSKNKAAYSSLVREGVRFGASPLDSLLRLVERRQTKDAKPSKHPLILVIGAPRSGTTLVYQALAHFLDVTYPSNGSSLFVKSPITAARIQKKLVRRLKPSFENYYGQTRRLSDCNDAFELWNRWLGEDRYAPRSELTDEQSCEMQNFFDTWMNAFDKPFLNKNNRNAFAVRVLARHLPNAKFVVVRRNPVFVAQSLIVARKKIQGSESIGWGLNSSSTIGKPDPLAYVDDVCSQIKTIDDEMDSQLIAVDGARVINVTYEGFCNAPQQTIAEVAARFDGLELDADSNLSQLEPFEISQKLTINRDEINRICQRFGIASPAAAPA